MSASGKSSNRHYEYNRGYLGGGGHGIYAAAGQADRAREQRVTPTCPHAVHARPAASSLEGPLPTSSDQKRPVWRRTPRPGWLRRAVRATVREVAREVLR